MTETRLRLPGASRVLQLAVQKSVDLVSFGLHVAGGTVPEELTVPDSFGQITAAANRRMTVAEARAEFSTWVLATGLRDCVEALGAALEWARKECVLWSQLGSVERRADGSLTMSAEMTGGTWNTQIVADARRFDRMPLPDKIRHLATRFLLAAPPFTDDILTLNAAPNCLAHRSGIVGREDLRSPEDVGLVVAWRRWKLTALGADGTRSLHQGSRVEAGETVQIRLESTSRTFTVGERISLTAEEYVEIATTFVLYAQQLEKSIRSMQEARFAAHA